MQTLRTAGLAVLICFAAPGQQQMFVGDARDAAANERGIAAGSMFIVKANIPVPAGLRMAPLPLPGELGGVSVRLTPIGSIPAAPVIAYMYYTYADPARSIVQLAAVAPSSTRPGDYMLSVATPSGTATGGTARVVANKFRAFTNNQEGYALAAAQVQLSPTRVDRVMFAAGVIPGGQTKAPAQAGQTLLLWGTGLGAISEPDNAAPGVIDMKSQLDVRVSVGGVEAAVLYAGRAPAYPGIDQINFNLPANVPTGCNVALQVTVRGQPSNPVTLAIAPPGAPACPHPYLTAYQLEALDQGQALRAGQFYFAIYREPFRDVPAVEIHSVLGSFRDVPASLAGSLSVNSVAPGRCVLFRGNAGNVGPAMSSRLILDAGAESTLDAGRVTVSGMSLPSVALDRDNGYYYRVLSAFREDTQSVVYGTAGHRFTPGAQALQADGGQDMGRFQVSVQMPPPLRWTNRDEVANVSRGSPLPLAWSGGSALDAVFIQGVSGESEEAGAFLCVAAPGERSFSVPAAVLQAMPAGVGILRIAAFSGASTVFNVAAVKPAAIGPSTLDYLMMTTRVVTYR